MNEKQLVVNNLLINYYFFEEKGRAAKTVVFLHGWRADGKIWAPIMRLLADRGKYNLYALDLPGFGKSQKPPGAFAVGDYADTVKEFAAKLELKKLIPVGHSFGGRIAIKLAANFPELVEKLVLVDSAGIRQETIRKRTIDLIAKPLKPLFKLPGLRTLRPAIYKAIGSEDYVTAGELRESFIKAVNEDLTAELPKIKQKTLLVWGQNDKDTSIEHARIMEKGISNSSLIIYKDAGHFSFLDRMPDFGKDLTRFINE